MAKTAKFKSKREREIAFDNERSKQMLPTTQQYRALQVLNLLHANNFRRLWLDSDYVQGEFGSDVRPEFMLKVVVDEENLDTTRMGLLMALASDLGVSLVLTEIRMNQQSFSRLALWVLKDAD